jgi:hypothetical protein
MFRFNYSRTSHLCYVLAIVESSCICSVLATVEPLFWCSAFATVELLIMFSFNYSRTSYLCSVLTTVETSILTKGSTVDNTKQSGFTVIISEYEQEVLL